MNVCGYRNYWCHQENARREKGLGVEGIGEGGRKRRGIRWIEHPIQRMLRQLIA